MTKKTFSWTILVIALMLAGIFAVTAQPSNNEAVYLVKTNEPGVKAQFDVRHEFSEGFTVKLSERAVAALERRGFEVEEVPLYYIVQPMDFCDRNPDHHRCQPDDGDDDNGNGDEEGTTRTYFPNNQITWGVQRIHEGTITSTNGGEGITVAVLDTGVMKEHLDLEGRVTDCRDFTRGGRVRPECKDGHGHGTHVVGTIVAHAGSDGQGIYGVAPEASIMALKVCGNSGACWSDDIAAGIRYAAENGAHIVSMSLGGSTESSLVRNAINDNLHVLYVAASGNSGPSEGSINYPAANPNVVAVGAIDINDNVPSFSSRGINSNDCPPIKERYIEFAAPGVSVESTWNDGGYRSISGTSMAAPHVSGLAAKLWQESADNTRNYLQTLRENNHCGNIDWGFGIPVAPNN